MDKFQVRQRERNERVLYVVQHCMIMIMAGMKNGTDQCGCRLWSGTGVTTIKVSQAGVATCSNNNNDKAWKTRLILLCLPALKSQSSMYRGTVMSLL